MKLITLLVLTFFFISNSFSQVHEIPTNQAKWINSRTVDYSTPPTYYYYENNYTHFCMYGIDTIINSVAYTKVEDCNNGIFYGAFRNINGLSFFMPKDSTQEYLVYDFTSSIRDTIENVYFQLHGINSSMEDFVVSHIDSILIGNDYRQTFSFTNGQSWTEGIGGNQGFLWDSYPAIGNTNSELICHSYGDSIMQDPNNIQIGGCDNTLNLINQQHEPSFTIFPNPTSGHINISYNRINANEVQLIVFDFIGKEILREDYIENEKIDLSKLPQGTYIINLIDGTFSLQQKIVVLK